MHALIVYDSAYGNTEKIVKAVGKGLQGDVKIKHVTEVNESDMDTIDVLIVASPVHGGTYTPEIGEFISAIPYDVLSRVKVATLDTRFASEDHGIGLRFLMFIIRFAADKIARVLKKRGASIIVRPEGFIVQDTEGPLKDGELQRAINWGRKINLALK